MTAVDWSVLSLENVDEDIALCADRLACQFPNIADADDLLQEGRIWAAENADVVRVYVNDERMGQFRNRVYSRLHTKVATEARKQGRQIPLAVLIDSEV